MIQTIIVEDDYRVAQIHEEFVNEFKDFNLIGKAKNAGEAIDFLKNNPVDLIFLDVYMPDRLGTDLLKEIRTDFPGVDIIMITAAKDKSLVRTAMEYGVFRYLIKPVKIGEFKSALNDYKKFKQIFSKDNEELEANHLSQLFSYNLKEEKILPTGINAVTLEKVAELIEANSNGLTSEEVGRELGASRTTARRYLEYLVGNGKAKAESVYGIVGRPERKYFYRK